MTNYFILILLLTGCSSFGQSADSIDKIVFSFANSHSSWGEAGIFGKGETIELKKTADGDFRFSRQFTTTASAGNNGNTFHTDTTEIATDKYIPVKKGPIQFWLSQLSTNQENFNAAFIKPKLTKPTKLEILGAARKYDLLWTLQDPDFDRNDRADVRIAIKEMKQFAGLDSFLTYKRPTIEFDMAVMDSYNALRILIIQMNDTIEYRCQFFEPLGQPITRFVKGNYTASSKVFNLAANTAALAFLPKGSMIAKALSLDNIKEQYVKWYLEKF